MARVPYLDPDDETADRIRTRRGGGLTPLDQVLMHNAQIASGWNELLGAVRQASSLPPDVRELVIVQVAVLNRATYEWDAHAPLARKYGVAESALDHVRSGQDPSPLTSEQRTALDFATQLTLGCRVDDDVFARAREQLGTQGVVDLTATVAAYNMVSRFLTALDVDERLEP